jgi:mRNA interferase HigB
MRVIARRTLLKFVASRAGTKDHAALKAATDAWFHEAKKAAWASMARIKALYGTASVVSASRVVFNIKGNDYRLVVEVHFRKQIVWIKWFGTHADYDKISVKELKYVKGR